MNKTIPINVAPFTGAWIEMVLSDTPPPCELVAPFTGAWIEIVSFWNSTVCFDVAPFTGAWIEITNLQQFEGGAIGRSLHGSVD